MKFEVDDKVCLPNGVHLDETWQGTFTSREFDVRIVTAETKAPRGELYLVSITTSNPSFFFSVWMYPWEIVPYNCDECKYKFPCWTDSLDMLYYE